MVDPRRASDMNQAAARFAGALAESYRIAYGQAAEAQERQARFAREFSERVLEHLREQTEGVRAVSEALADQARRQQAAGRELAQESVDAYVEFLDTAFSGYQTGAQRATGSAQEEGARAVSRFSDYVVGSAAGATRATAESAAGQPPIDGYDELDVGELIERLGDLTVDQLQEVKHYEERNKNRETLIEEIDRRLTGSA